MAGLTIGFLIAGLLEYCHETPLCATNGTFLPSPNFPRSRSSHIWTAFLDVAPERGPVWKPLFTRR